MNDALTLIDARTRELSADDRCTRDACLSDAGPAEAVQPADEARARRAAQELVARFVKDPHAFAAGARVADTNRFMNDYRDALDRRLAAAGRRTEGDDGGLATRGMPAFAPGDWLPAAGDDGTPADLAPRMGVVAVVAAAAAVVTAACAVASIALAAGLIHPAKK